MASSYMLRPLHASSGHLLCPPPPDRPRSSHSHHGLRRRNARHLSSMRCMRDWTHWLQFSSQLTRSGSSSSSYSDSVKNLLWPNRNLSVHVSALLDTGTKVGHEAGVSVGTSSVSANGSGNPNGNASAKPEFPPPDFDHEIYASMTMDCFQPPPPPRIPFGGPFEDYYDVIVGEDYIPKQEKPTSSFLMFLESLNKKRNDIAVDPPPAGSDVDAPLFPRSSAAVENRPRSEPLFPQSRSSSEVRNDPLSRPLISQQRPIDVSPAPISGSGSGLASTNSQSRPSQGQGSYSDQFSSRNLVPQTRGAQESSFSSTSSLGESSSAARLLSSQTRTQDSSTESATARDDAPRLSRQVVQSSTEPSTDSGAAESSADSSTGSGVPHLSRQTPAYGYPGDSNRSLSPQLRTSENMPIPSSSPEQLLGNRSLTPSTRSSGEVPDQRPLSPTTRSPEATNRILSPVTSSFSDTRDQSGYSVSQTAPSENNSRSLFPQTRSDGEIRQSGQPYSPQQVPTVATSGSLLSESRSFDQTGAERTLSPATRSGPQSTPGEEIQDRSTSPFYQTTQDTESRQTSQPFSGRLSRPVSTGSSMPPTRPADSLQESRDSSQGRPVEQTRDMGQLIPETRQAAPLVPEITEVEAAISSSPLVPSEVIPPEVPSRSLFPQTRQRESISGSFIQTKSVEDPTITSRELPGPARADGVSDSRPSFLQSVPVSASWEDRQRQPPQTPTATDSQVALVRAGQESVFYEPKEGDMVLGAVVYSDNQQLELEIGAQLPAVMALREFEPFPQVVDNAYFKLPPNGMLPGGFIVPKGKSFIVDGKNADDGSYRDTVELGTVVLAEVQGRAITDGRAILTCRLPARRLAWHRVEQLMRLGETIQLEIVQWNEGGLLGYLEGIRAFLPRSELLQKPESSALLKDYVGRTLTVAVVQADRQASNCIISEAKAWMGKNLLLGTVHNLTVTRIYSYGLQVEIENTRIRGFLHISNISQEYVNSVTNFFSEGDKVRAMLIKGRNPGQVSFSTAELESDRGLMLRDKEQVYQEADDIAKSVCERLSQQERDLFTLAASQSHLDFQDPGIANLRWLKLA